MTKNFWPIYIVFFYFFLLQHRKVNHLVHYILCINHLVLSLTKSLPVSYAYVSIESTDCITLSSFHIISTLCLPLLNFCFIFNIDFFFYKFFNTIYVSFTFFLNNLFYSQVDFLLNSFCNFQIYVYF